MTLAEWIKAKLASNGLSFDQAVEVYTRCLEDRRFKGGGWRWDGDKGGYPAMVLAAAWMSVKAIALEWIDELHPGAPFRPLFDDFADAPPAEAGPAAPQEPARDSIPAPGEDQTRAGLSNAPRRCGDTELNDDNTILPEA